MGIGKNKIWPAICVILFLCSGAMAFIGSVNDKSSFGNYTFNNGMSQINNVGADIMQTDEGFGAAVSEAASRYLEIPTAFHCIIYNSTGIYMRPMSEALINDMTHGYTKDGARYYILRREFNLSAGGRYSGYYDYEFETVGVIDYTSDHGFYVIMIGPTKQISDAQIMTGNNSDSIADSNERLASFKTELESFTRVNPPSAAGTGLATPQKLYYRGEKAADFSAGRNLVYIISGQRLIEDINKNMPGISAGSEIYVSPPRWNNATDDDKISQAMKIIKNGEAVPEGYYKCVVVPPSPYGP